MKRTLAFGAMLFVASLTLAGAQTHEKAKSKKPDKSVHHAAMHAEHTVHNNAMKGEHWLDHHLSAPHRKTKPAPKKHATKKKDKSVHHAAMHAEHWIDGHASAPHKKN